MSDIGQDQSEESYLREIFSIAKRHEVIDIRTIFSKAKAEKLIEECEHAVASGVKSAAVKEMKYRIDTYADNHKTSQFLVFMEDSGGVWQSSVVHAPDRVAVVVKRVGMISVPLVYETEVWTTGTDERNFVTLQKHLVKQMVEVVRTDVYRANEEDS